MKARLEYDLNDPDDTASHLRAVKSLDLALILWDFNYNAKKSIEYDIEDKLNKGEKLSPYDAVDLVFNKFHELLNERGIIIDDLIN